MPIELDDDVRPRRPPARTGSAHLRMLARHPGRDRRLHRVRAAAVRAPRTRRSTWPASPGPGRPLRDNRAVHAMARLLLHGRIDNIQSSWVKLGADGCRDDAARRRERPRRHADGGDHQPDGRVEDGSAKTVAELRDIAARAGRPARQRTTTYGEVSAERAAAAGGFDSFARTLSRWHRPADPRTIREDTTMTAARATPSPSSAAPARREAASATGSPRPATTWSSAPGTRDRATAAADELAGRLDGPARSPAPATSRRREGGPRAPGRAVRRPRRRSSPAPRAAGGKIVVSCVNPLGFDKQGPFGLDVPAGSAAEAAAGLLPDSTVVGAFHHLSAVTLITDEELPRGRARVWRRPRRRRRGGRARPGGHRSPGRLRRDGSVWPASSSPSPPY